MLVKKNYLEEVFQKNHKLLPCDMTSDENITGSEDQEQLEKEEQTFLEEQRSSSKGHSNKESSGNSTN